MTAVGPGLLLGLTLLLSPAVGIASDANSDTESKDQDTEETQVQPSEPTAADTNNKLADDETSPPSAETLAPSPPKGLALPAELPEVLDAPQPNYPAAALEAGIGGRVVLELQLDAFGSQFLYLNILRFDHLEVFV